MLTEHALPPRAGEPAGPVRIPVRPDSRVVRRRILDRVARGVVTLGGTAVIASILAILFVIVVEVLPLFSSAELRPLSPVDLKDAGTPLAAGTEEYRELSWVVTPSGPAFFSLADGLRIPVESGLALGPATVTSAGSFRQGSLALGLSDGRAVQTRFLFTSNYVDGKRRLSPALKVEAPVAMDPAGRPLRRIAQAVTDLGPLLAAITGPREVALVTLKRKKALVGEGKIEVIPHSLSLNLESDLGALALDARGEDLYLGTADGQLVRVNLRNLDQPKPAAPLLASTRAGSAVTMLGFLNGDRTLVVGDAAGGVTSWQTLRSEDGNYYLAKVHGFDPHEAAVVAFSPSARDKGFVTSDQKGGIHLNYSTTGKTLIRLPAGGEPAQAVALTPKANGLIALDSSGRMRRWDLENAHPETTLGTLFGKVWYEGYSQPEDVWQSTGGTSDDFEPKFGLWPLIYGTLKGTFYALLIAVPLALLAALYVSQFMHSSYKANIKPVIEVMAALPSVVLGFIAALWLAPIVEKRIPGIALLPFVEALLILGAVAAWRSLPLGTRQRFRHGSEVVLILPIIVLGFVLAFGLGGWMESAFLAGDYRGWLHRTLGLSYDQRNSVVVGLAMGFAVVPIIFTIAEDSLSNVPPYLAAGSLALGATRWQTAIKVILPSASPGIFSAIMIGFGRAVGETMIVLMATGNTALTNASPFKGFRALSANVAVELPEAPEGGTLFRVLFLAAFLLFLLTFVVNTAAELIRLRLRRKFQSL